MNTKTEDNVIANAVFREVIKKLLFNCIKLIDVLDRLCLCKTICVEVAILLRR